jgi:NDP-sugar pyrophosphorylase family protein
MKAMIFAAGLGTRFKPWTDSNPKALAIINGKSLLQRNIEYLQKYGITDVVVNVHHFADIIIDTILAKNGWGSSITISDERNEVLETGGGLLNARQYLENNKPFITLNADILTDFPIDELIEFHQQKNALISFGVSNRKTSRNFLFDENNQLCGWENNVTGEQRISIQNKIMHPLAYSCVAIFEPTVFDKIPQRGKFSLTDTYLSLAEENLIAGFEHNNNRWIDVGKPESVEVAEALFGE